MVTIHNSPSTRVLFGVSDLVNPLPITYLISIVSSCSYSIFKVQRDMSSLRSSGPSLRSGPSFSPAFHRLDHFARLVTSPRLSSSTSSIPLCQLWSFLLARGRMGGGGSGGVYLHSSAACVLHYVRIDVVVMVSAAQVQILIGGCDLVISNSDVAQGDRRTTVSEHLLKHQ